MSNCIITKSTSSNLIKQKTIDAVLKAGYATGDTITGIARYRIVGSTLCKNDDVYFTPIVYSFYDTGVLEVRAIGGAPEVNRHYQFIVNYI